MNSTLFVISDLHLGGDDGFQMCSARGRELLAEFVDWVATQKPQAGDVRLVIAGDIVDFLAERDKSSGFSAFIENEADALGILNRILRREKAIFAALANLCRAGVGLTLLLGNHDIELSFPALRARLHEVLETDRLEFLYDNEAFTCGSLLIEHGNRYDGFNKVDHDGLRRVRSHFSRREELQEPFAIQPGSTLVAEVMNRIKEKYSFVDLLKPETANVMPILAALDSRVWANAGEAVKLSAEAWARSGTDKDGVPKRREFISASSPEAREKAGPVTLPEQAAFDLADEALKQERSEQIGWFNDIKVSLLLKAFRRRREQDAATFEIKQESKDYLTPASAFIKRGFQVVVMGHTHLAKQINVDQGTYLNTGTWADLMCLPPAIYDADEAKALLALEEFLKDVVANRVDKYRRPIPTFARIEVDDSGARGATFFYDGKGKTEELTTKGLLERLGAVA